MSTSRLRSFSGSRFRKMGETARHERCRGRKGGRARAQKPHYTKRTDSKRGAAPSSPSCRGTAYLAVHGQIAAVCAHFQVQGLGAHRFAVRLAEVRRLGKVEQRRRQAVQGGAR